MLFSFTNFLLLSTSAITLGFAAPSPDLNLPPLSDYVNSHLKTRHPSEYKYGGFGNFTARDIQGLLETRAVELGMDVPFGDTLDKRAQRNGRITRCTTSSCMGE